MRDVGVNCSSGVGQTQIDTGLCKFQHSQTFSRFTGDFRCWKPRIILIP